MTDAPEQPQTQGGFRFWMIVPALGALSLIAVFFLGLGREDARVLPSALIDQPVPEFTLSGLQSADKALSTADLSGNGVQLVNIWASWCGPCRIEHPQIQALADLGIPVHGINYKDSPAAAKGFLSELGDPYTRIGVDQSGRAGIDWGVYGVPETFIVNNAGQIVYKHVGPILPEHIESRILPAIQSATEPQS